MMSNTNIQMILTAIDRAPDGIHGDPPATRQWLHDHEPAAAAAIEQCSDEERAELSARLTQQREADIAAVRELLANTDHNDPEAVCRLTIARERFAYRWGPDCFGKMWELELNKSARVKCYLGALLSLLAPHMLPDELVPLDEALDRLSPDDRYKAEALIEGLIDDGVMEIDPRTMVEPDARH
jgi:hypothetical protein